jgi:transcriptional regulator with XRE-family HTH domain
MPRPEISNRILYLIELREGGVKARFARAIGIPTGQLNNYVKDNPSIPKSDLQQRIADYYGVTIAWLNGYDAPSEQQVEQRDKAPDDVYRKLAAAEERAKIYESLYKELLDKLTRGSK